MKEKENENIMLLNLIYQNAEMGLLGINTVIKKIQDESLAKLIKAQQKEYENILKEVTSILIKYGVKEEEISKLKEITSKMMSEAMTIIPDDKKIAKLMTEGNEKGVIALQEKINAFEIKDEEIISLLEHFMNTLEHNREELKEFL